MKKLLARLWSKIDDLISPIRDGVSKLNKKLDTFFDFSWTLSSLFSKLSFIVAGIFSLISSLTSLLFAILNFGSLVDLVKGTVTGGSYWLEKLENIVGGYPSFQSLINSMDVQLSGLSQFFTPPLTFTRILQVTGIGDVFNTVVVCAVQGIAFVISMRLLFWSLGRVKLRMVKPIK